MRTPVLLLAVSLVSASSTTNSTVSSRSAAFPSPLDADPLTDIRNTRRIQAVVLDGRWLDAAELKRLKEPK